MTIEIQQKERKGEQTDLQELRFIAKVTSLGKDRIIVVVPKEHFNKGKPLRGKFVRVILQELSLDDEKEEGKK